jgi:MFS family permease
VSRRHYVGIFFLSFATLLLELAFTRVLTVANWYHFGFLIISMALLGFGTSGVVLTLWTSLRERASMDRALAMLSIAFGSVVIAGYWSMQKIPFHPLHLLSDHRQHLFMPLYYIAVAAPFFCSGLAIGLLLFRGRERAHRLYAADLFGAALGCAAIAAVMPLFGGSGTVIVAAAFGFLAASVFGLANARGLAVTGLVLAILAVPLAFGADQLLPISVSETKQHPLRPTDRAPVFTAWNTFSRVDVYDFPAAPEKGWPDAGFSIMIDASAGTGIGDLSGGIDDYLRSAQYRPTGIPYVGKTHPRVLILGSGAGREVLEALYFGARSVTAVDINPIINDIVSRRMRSAWGGLFDRPEVKLVTEEGRSFVQGSKEKYDVIVSIQTMTAAAVTSGALTMSEAYMFTREAFANYLDHLTADGVILITRGLDQIEKLFATAREVFEERGWGSPANHLLAFEGPLAPFGHQLFNQAFLFKKSPWTFDELDMLKERLGVGHPERWFGRSPEIYYSPEMTLPSSGDYWPALLAEVLASPNLSAFYAGHREQFSPATDDRPFFNQVVRWTALRPSDLRGLFASAHDNVRAVPTVEIMLIMMLLQASIIAFALIILPLGALAHRGLQISQPWTLLVYFAGLGLGFIMIEIVFIQRFLLFLGEPVYTFAVVLAGLLGFTGIGSWTVGRLNSNDRVVLMYIFPAILLVLLGTAIASPWIFTSALGLPLHWRIVVVVAMLAPLGTFLGMPFPIGLRILAKEAPPFIPWAWGVNGFFTVVGSIAASILGMAFGFTAVLTVSGACYLIALLAMTVVRTAPVMRETTAGSEFEGVADRQPTFVAGGRPSE